MSKKVLGLDLGTNSIGWALVNYIESIRENQFQPSNIIDIGSRIIPMDAAALSDFDNGNLKTQTAERTRYRSVRRLHERYLLRRERLHRVLYILGFLPEHYAKCIDFEKNTGKFLSDSEPKIAYSLNDETDRYEFYFKESFVEMIQDFVKYQPELVKDGKKVPYDWTIYYLRKKALSEQISKEELAWLILHFNQKRGYYQQRGEEEDINEAKEYQKLHVVSVEDSGDKKGDAIWYNVLLENGDTYKKLSRIPLDWIGKTKEFIVTSKVDKDNNEKRTYSIPTDGDWTLIKKRTEKEIEESYKTVGSYIYDTLLANPNQKIKGKLIQTIERRFYRKELNQILNKQREFHPELNNQGLYNLCITDLYKSNNAYRNSIQNKDFVYLFIDDIIFYQRPLKSKKSLIENCQYEYRTYKNPKTGEPEKEYLKCISKSHPLFEEFRLWQFLKNVRIIRRDDSMDVTNLYLPDEDSYVALFDKLKEKKEVVEKSFLSLIKGAKLKDTEYTWNYGDRSLPMCPTHAEFINRLKHLNLDDNFLMPQIEEHLWHILYSVSDKQELEQALKSFALKYEIENLDEFVAELKKIKPFDKDYASYSSKAIKKLLPLMRIGNHWEENTIEKKTKERINKIIDGEYCETINEITREKVKKELGEELSLSLFRGLPLWLACYVVYNRHSEAGETTKWESPEDIDKFLEAFKQHSLRNPVVEQIVTETLRVVRDIWVKHGNLFEIHIELGREMRNPAKKRQEITRRNLENENTNQRIKALLSELKNEGNDVRPESLSQQERLKIYEEGVLGSDIEIPEDIVKITRQKQPTQSEIIRYKCWLEQGYCSPYTGKPIPLGRLFTSEYDIEHIIPQARYYDDSFSNKIICESAVNKDKSSMLACEYIRLQGGKNIQLGNGKQVTVLSFEEYEDFVKRNFKNSSLKKKKLLMDEIPDYFIERQMNDTRYISRYIKGLLSNIVREENEQEATSKNIISVTGVATSKLKEDWGLNDIWNKIVTPRFERLNELTKSNNYGHWVDKQTFRIQVPEANQRGFSKKRIDHRHHAMDALVIACATRSHVNYLNNQSAKLSDKETRYDLKMKLCSKNKQGKWLFDKPWETFTQDTQEALANIIISFKQNQRIINKSTNKYQKYEDGVKKLVSQTSGDNWAIRKPLHKETVYGRVNLQLKKTVTLPIALDNWRMIIDKEIRDKIKLLFDERFDKKQILAYFKKIGNRYNQKDISKIEVYYFSDEKEPLVATRKTLDSSFTVKNINAVTDSGIRQILLRHLEKYQGKTEDAFSPDGIEDMNTNIRFLNNGKFHKPIYKVRVPETLGNKFQVGYRGNKKAKYVEAAQGTNLFFAVYQSGEGKRSFDTIPLNIVIENLKRGENAVPPANEKGDRLLFTLSPNDLVYVPTEEQRESKIGIGDIEKNKNRIYKMVSATGSQCFFIPYYIASAIIPTTELGTNNKAQRAWTGEMIKEICLKIEIGRLGHIVNIAYD
ncbi:type II CRISPR RNA-guided endonuclease Cas9 [Dysgonomonas sp. 521]|uniref:type II CRISPR RNA-guided endonuclease Cas9 n=1 Tax=Dysgonomonas sp. 521 TaxID=2302932 RepID=UPI0013D723EE|nr:type II CRISPR RNA-guided endonuclease Cas9 [Dysgonomonas sp. 521]NDV94355.1 type II CRISPR RNA-guided endonuclease Cas9 [Dysgonomonas sp. 521]